VAVASDRAPLSSSHGSNQTRVGMIVSRLARISGVLRDIEKLSSEMPCSLSQICVKSKITVLLRLLYVRVRHCALIRSKQFSVVLCQGSFQQLFCNAVLARIFLEIVSSEKKSTSPTSTREKTQPSFGPCELHSNNLGRLKDFLHWDFDRKKIFYCSPRQRTAWTVLTPPFWNSIRNYTTPR
jgi:hypothetical protein